jgi:outer membrane protein OmpA-like peptidoglycan-associated protein
MMQSLESGAPDPKAQSADTSFAAPSEGSALRFRWLLVPLVLGLIAIWPLSSLRGTSEETAVTLPDGVSLDAPKDSSAYELAHFLANPSDPYVPRVLVLDRLSFKSGSTDITPKSQKTVLDLSAVLEAFPSAKVRLEGHTDNTGDRWVKKRLSLKRAEAVKALLTKAGVDPSHVNTDERPIASNDTAEGRAQNRRLEFVILEK